MSETIVGTLDAVTEKGDWTTFEINVGSQYPVRLSTKVAELIELGRAAKGQEMEWTFTATEGNINPKSGKPYINRYFEGVAPVSENHRNATASPTTAPREYTPDLKDRMIVRQTCLKAAGELFSGKGNVIPDVIDAAMRFETWVYRDIDPVPFAPELSEHDQQISYP